MPSHFCRALSSCPSFRAAQTNRPPTRAAGKKTTRFPPSLIRSKGSVRVEVSGRLLQDFFKVSEGIGIAVTTVLTLAGLYFGNSLRLKTRAEVNANVAEKRFAAYAALWAQTKIASPMRGTPLTPAERSHLYEKLTDWYYDDGNGMLLTEGTRNIYLRRRRT